MKSIQYILCLGLLSPLGLFAQGPITKDKTTVDVSYKSDITDTPKENPAPSALKKTEKKPQNYIVPTHLAKIQYAAPTIRPLGMPVSKLPRNKAFYLKAGLGFPLSPLAELSYDYTTNPQFRFGFDVKHHSLLNGYFDNQTFSKTLVGADGTYFTANDLGIGAAIEYTNNQYNFYGYDSLALPTGDSMKQTFSNFAMAVDLFNTSSKNGMTYKVSLPFYTYSDRYNSNEFNIAPIATLSKMMGRRDQHKLSVAAKLDYTSFNHSDSSSNRTFLYLQPEYFINSGAFKANLGFNLGTNTGKFFFNPMINLSYSLPNNIATIFAAAEGGVRANTFKSLTEYNPFLISTPEIRHSNFLDLYGGLKGAISKIKYEFAGGYTLANNLPFFVNDSLSNFGRFNVLYDSASTGIVFVKAAAEINIVKNLSIGGSLYLKNYQLASLERAFHLPTFESNYYLTYSLFFDKKNTDRNVLRVKGEVFINAGVAYYNELTQTNKTLNGLFDFNAGLDYQINDKASLFVQVNNILHNQNQRWNKYRQLGINAMLGLTLRF